MIACIKFAVRAFEKIGGGCHSLSISSVGEADSEKKSNKYSPVAG